MFQQSVKRKTGVTISRPHFTILIFSVKNYHSQSEQGEP